jgi:mitochondrial import receptor subunit TOM40
MAAPAPTAFPGITTYPAAPGVVVPSSIDLAPPPAQSTLEKILNPLYDNTAAKTLRQYYNTFQERRETLGLTNPGTVEGISREVSRDVLATNLMFSGLRADLTKAFSAIPLFQTAHNFTMGANAPPYSFAVLYGSSKVC